MENLAYFDNLQFDVQKEMKVILTTSYKCSRFLKGYHPFQNMWDTVKWEIIQGEMEPVNSVDKYAIVAIREGHVLGQFYKGTSRKFAKAYSTS